MALVAAGTTAAVVLPVGATMTFSGLGTHQTSPPGSTGAPSKQLVGITSQTQTIGPFTVAVTLNLAAAANGPGVNYSFASALPVGDTLTQSTATVSRNLVQADSGTIIPVANGITLTAVGGTLVNFSAIILPVTGATVSLAFTGGATGNGASTTITRARSANVLGFAVNQDPASGADAFAVGGA